MFAAGFDTKNLEGIRQSANAQQRQWAIEQAVAINDGQYLSVAELIACADELVQYITNGKDL